MSTTLRGPIRSWYSPVTLRSVSSSGPLVASSPGNKIGWFRVIGLKYQPIRDKHFTTYVVLTNQRRVSSIHVKHQPITMQYWEKETETTFERQDLPP